MAHKTKIDGTEYEITGGKCLIGGTAYKIKKGRTRIGGTGYDIEFGKRLCTVTINVIPGAEARPGEVYAVIYGTAYGVNNAGSDEYYLDRGTLVTCQSYVGAITHDGEDKWTSYEFEISSDIKISVTRNGVTITTVPH